MDNRQSPFAPLFQDAILKWLRSIFGLPANSFTAPLFSLTGIKSPFYLTLKLFVSLVKRLSAD